MTDTLNDPPLCSRSPDHDNTQHEWVASAWETTPHPSPQRGGESYVTRWRCKWCLLSVSGQQVENYVEAAYGEAVMMAFAKVP